MINQELLNPKSIAIIGGSNNVHKPGGAVVRNLLSGGYSGTLRIVNPKEVEVQGINVFHCLPRNWPFLWLQPSTVLNT